MKHIAVAVEENNLQSKISHRPGHCKWFCILEKDKTPRFIENHGAVANKAFGAYAFNTLFSEHIDTVVALFFGPRFQELCRNSNVQLLIPPSGKDNLSDILKLNIF
jgi:predicted Fe-Mo cluster-binding NifX family protein